MPEMADVETQAPAPKRFGFKLTKRCPYCRRRLWAWWGLVGCRTPHPGVSVWVSKARLPA